jgi:membrane associated rhomboid family serine protease
MLDDRDQTRRRPQHELQWSMTVLIIAVNVAVYILQNIFDRPANAAINNAFSLSVSGLKHGHLWQLITFQFMHAPIVRGGILHLLGNCFTIYLFGPGVEKALGRLGFLKLYLLSGAVGGLLQMTVGILWPEHFGQSIIGASAGALGLLAAFATYFPSRLVHIFFLPFPVRADILLAAGVIGALIGLFVPSGHVAHCAHLGGILWGFIFARRTNRVDHPAPLFRNAKNLLKIKTVRE